MYKYRRFWEFLEQIRALYTNKDEYSHIRVAFRELHSEKQPLEENTQNYIQNNHIQKNHTSFSSKKVIQGDQVIQGD